jgi:hypothetical protein
VPSPTALKTFSWQVRFLQIPLALPPPCLPSSPFLNFVTDSRSQPTDESLVKGWVVISINPFDVEQRRVLLLSTRAMYRVKFDFDTAAIERFEKTPLADVIHAQRGQLIYSRFSLTGALDKRMKKTGTQFGVRIFSKEAESEGVAVDGATHGQRKLANPFAKKQTIRTFRALDSVTPEEAKQVMWDLAETLAQAIRAALPESVFYLSEEDIVRQNAGGPVSFAMNKLK